jgi:hypothetical protein
MNVDTAPAREQSSQPLQLPQPPKASGTKGIWSFLALLVIFTVAFLPAIAAAMRGDINGLPELIGFGLGSLLIPAIIAAVICRKDQTRFPKVLFYSFFICYALTSANRNRVTEPPEGTDKHIGEILREVMSSTPANPTNTQPYDAAIRETFKQMLAAKKSYETATANIDVTGVYQPESFSNNAAMRKWMDDARVLNAADQKMLRAWESMPQILQTQINASSMSSSDKQAVMRGFEGSFNAGALMPRLKTSVEWSASLSDLYGFALENSSHIHVKGDRITIADDAVRDQFNKKQEASQTLLQKVQDFNRAYKAQQEQTAKRFGLTEPK